MKRLVEHSLFIVCLVALLVTVTGLAIDQEILIVTGLLIAAFCALAERMRGRTDVTLNRDGFRAKSTLVGPEDVVRELFEVLQRIGVERGPAREAVERIQRRALEILPKNLRLEIEPTEKALVDLAQSKRRVAQTIASGLIVQECAICGHSASNAYLEAAHIVPLMRGGQHTLDNLLTLCSDCHRGPDMGVPAVPA